MAIINDLISLIILKKDEGIRTRTTSAPEREEGDGTEEQIERRNVKNCSGQSQRIIKSRDVNLSFVQRN